MGFICSIIIVEDITRSRKLYEGILHMKVTSDFGDQYNIGFEGGLSLYRKAFFEELTGCPVNLDKNNNVALYFEVEDLDDLEKAIAGNSFEFVHPVREQPWKQRTFRFYDFDHHILEVAEKMDGVLRRLQKEGCSMDEIARLTGYPVSEVLKVLEPS
jgi:catechol 2,3-dioxygenase-like lactoylglutathione lyase family enzyme